MSTSGNQQNDPYTLWSTLHAQTNTNERTPTTQRGETRRASTNTCTLPPPMGVTYTEKRRGPARRYGDVRMPKELRASRPDTAGKRCGTVVARG